MRKRQNNVSVLFMLFSILFCVCLITANVLETKQISFGLVNITGGLLVFPVSYIINDCVCEVWGYRKARLLIWTGFAMNFIFVMFGALADFIPGAPYWDNEDGFRSCSSYCRCLVCSLSCRFVHQRIRDEPHEIVVGRKAFLCPCRCQYYIRRDSRLADILSFSFVGRNSGVGDAVAYSVTGRAQDIV